MTEAEYRARARAALAGKWPRTILVSLVAALLGGAGSGTGNSTLGLKVEEKIEKLYDVMPELASFVMGAVGVIVALIFVYGVVMLVLGGVVRLGYCRYNLKLVDGQKASMGDLFSQCDRFGQALALHLLTNLLVLLGLLLFIVPGIILSYSYAMASYILLEEPECTALEAMKRSRAMMKGHKGDLFCLYLSFFGWALLSIVTLGIGDLFLRPYRDVAEAVFYREMQKQTRGE